MTREAKIRFVPCNNLCPHNLARTNLLCSSEPRPTASTGTGRLRNCRPEPACRRPNVGRLSMHEACGQGGSRRRYEAVAGASRVSIFMVLSLSVNSQHPPRPSPPTHSRSYSSDHFGQHQRHTAVASAVRKPQAVAPQLLDLRLLTRRPLTPATTSRTPENMRLGNFTAKRRSAQCMWSVPSSKQGVCEEFGEKLASGVRLSTISRTSSRKPTATTSRRRNTRPQPSSTANSSVPSRPARAYTLNVTL
jgi:hypothetical protein